VFIRVHSWLNPTRETDFYTEAAEAGTRALSDAPRERSYTNSPILPEFYKRKRRPLPDKCYALRSLGYLLFKNLNPKIDWSQRSFPLLPPVKSDSSLVAAPPRQGRCDEIGLRNFRLAPSGVNLRLKSLSDRPVVKPSTVCGPTVGQSNRPWRTASLERRCHLTTASGLR
jgi:hypothetical protein